MVAKDWVPVADGELHYTTLNEDPEESHQLVLGFVPPGVSVLEVGPALGYMSAAILARGCRLVTVEKDPRAAAVARERGIDVRVGALEDQLITPPVDCVVVADVLEHVTDEVAFLAAVDRNLASGGHVVLSVPNVAHWSLRWSLLRGRFDYTDTGLLDRTHVRFYTLASLERTLSTAGFEVIARRASLGQGCYRRWRWLTLRWRQRRLIRWLADRWPALFAYQFVWHLRRRS